MAKSLDSRRGTEDLKSSQTRCLPPRAPASQMGKRFSNSTFPGAPAWGSPPRAFSCEPGAPLSCSLGGLRLLTSHGCCLGREPETVGTEAWIDTSEGDVLSPPDRTRNRPQRGLQARGCQLPPSLNTPLPTPNPVRARGRTQTNLTFNYIHLTRLSS